jgi:hypothetical protein
VNRPERQSLADQCNSFAHAQYFVTVAVRPGLRTYAMLPRDAFCPKKGPTLPKGRFYAWKADIPDL